TPRVVHMDFGIQKQIGERGMFSIDYVRELGTQFPLGIDTNHVGGANYLTDGDNLDPTQNTYQAELDAINATLAANTAAACPRVEFNAITIPLREAPSPISRGTGWIWRTRTADRFPARS